MALFADKFTPRSKGDPNLWLTPAWERLLTVNRFEDCPNLLVYGVAGTGKRTRIMLLLQEMFGPDVFSISKEKIVLNPTQETKINVMKGRKVDKVTQTPLELMAIRSPHHFEFTIASHAGEIISRLNELVKNYRRNTVFVIRDAHKLNRDTQSMMRHIMEHVSPHVRFILVSRSFNAVMAPLRSRCMPFGVSAQSNERLVYYISGLGVKLEGQLLERIVARSEGDIRLALMAAEASMIAGKLVWPEWRKRVIDLCKNIVGDRVYRRGHLLSTVSKILGSGVDSSTLYATIVKEIMRFAGDIDGDASVEFMCLVGEGEQEILRNYQPLMGIDLFLTSFHRWHHSRK